MLLTDWWWDELAVTGMPGEWPQNAKKKRDPNKRVRPKIQPILTNPSEEKRALAAPRSSEDEKRGSSSTKKRSRTSESLVKNSLRLSGERSKITATKGDSRVSRLSADTIKEEDEDDFSKASKDTSHGKDGGSADFDRECESDECDDESSGKRRESNAKKSSAGKAKTSSTQDDLEKSSAEDVEKKSDQDAKKISAPEDPQKNSSQQSAKNRSEIVAEDEDDDGIEDSGGSFKMSISEADGIDAEDEPEDERHLDDLDIGATTPNAETIGGESAVDGEGSVEDGSTLEVRNFWKFHQKVVITTLCDENFPHSAE